MVATSDSESFCGDSFACAAAAGVDAKMPVTASVVPVVSGLGSVMPGGVSEAPSTRVDNPGCFVCAVTVPDVSIVCWGPKLESGEPQMAVSKTVLSKNAIGAMP